MKGIVFQLTGLALAFASTAGTGKSVTAEQGEAKLAELLQDRTAGMPTSCIDTPYRIGNDGLQVIDGVGVVYKAGNTIYVARVADPKMLRRTDRLDVVRAVTTRLCTSDRMVARDRATGVQGGPVFLRDFVPYTKAG